LPTTVDNCPACFRVPTQRHQMKALLRAQEKNNAGLFPSLLEAMQPLMAATPAPVDPHRWSAAAAPDRT
jgi:tRNA 2-thiocytidine biosynthesis protein TtcA